MDGTWAGDVISKVLMGAVTVLLGIAVTSLQNMSAEIKTLSENVFELSSQSKVLNVTILNLEKRVDKLEVEMERVKLRDLKIPR
jgi:phage shock protein A